MKELDMKRITLKQKPKRGGGRKTWYWEVVKLTNATYPNIGDRLNREEVGDFCQSVDWEVAIS